MEQVQFSELKNNGIYKIEFLNGYKLQVKFIGIKGGRYYFLDEKGQEFSFANNSIVHLRFYKSNAE
ncbi:hypothetical protein NIES2107_12290 [Nostoc carneum NIES-2107]|nr:hypothetical protein NIES2107_12290 [Nostoc carneum NIES-2107]